MERRREEWRRRRERNHFRMERQGRRGSVFRRTEHSVFSHDALRIGEGVAEDGGQHFQSYCFLVSLQMRRRRLAWLAKTHSETKFALSQPFD